jgi:hypothetical protein
MENEMKRITTILALLCALPLTAAAAEEPFRWTGKLAAGQAIEIKGVNGGITATGGAGGEVEVTALKKGRRSDPGEVKIEVVEHADGVTICAVYPSEGRANECVAGEGGRMNVRNNDVNVEFRVAVPAGVRFVGRTVNGGIEATGLKADAEAHTVNGGVELDSTGTARAQTVNGGITARSGKADWTGTLKLQTVNGGIEVTMPEGLSADVKASTVNGDISTDFPLTVTGRIAKRKLQGTIGAGGRMLEMATVNGGIELKKGS